MKRSLGAKTLGFPNPVLVVGSYDVEGRANIMTAAWAGICCSNPPSLAVSLRKATYTYGNLMHSRAFTISVPSVEHVQVTDTVGIISGRNENKFKATHLTPIRSEKVNAPYVAEFPVIIECTLSHSFDLGLHTQFVGEIVQILADEDVLGPNGLPDMTKVDPLLYSMGNQSYFAMGQQIATSFSVGKKR